MRFIETDTHSEQDIYFSQYYKKEQLLFFDIETTGFSAASTVLYFIGCMYYKDNSWRVGQWFNDDGCSEQSVLKSFLELAAKHDILIHFNGEGFDLPYINQKREAYGISDNVSHMESIDIYKQIRPYKKALGLENLKLKTLEAYLHVGREDTHSGGELITVYDQYLHTQDEKLFELLFRHNYEDIKNMLDTCGILYYRDLFGNMPKGGSCHMEKDNIKLHFNAYLPRKLSLNKHHIYLTADGQEVTITIPVLTGELKYFFEDYKDYFYLPMEDTAIHKSVALYMDKNYRKKATKDTCYQKVNNYFVPTFGHNAERTFGSCYSQRKKYMEATVLQQPDMPLSSYILSILQWFNE